jgi:hypothetical protein
MTEICPRCQVPMVPECKGRGFIPVGGDTVKQCPNLYARQLKQHLGLEVSRVQHVTSSPFLKLGKPSEPPEVDLTDKNLFIKGCPWKNFLPHLKWVLGCKGLLFFFRVVTDERLKNIYVGNEDFRSRPKSTRNDVQTYNSMADIIGDDYHLVIIKLGYLGYKNVAAPGVLKEALSIREALHKPTWLLEDPSHSWNHSYDPDVGHYVDVHFQEIDIEASADPGVESMNVGIVVDDHNDEEIVARSEPHVFTPQRPIEPDEDEPEPESSLILEEPGADAPPKRKWRKRW